MNTLLEKLKQMPSPGDTKLEAQILYMEKLNELFPMPLTLSIMASLKELRGIKQKQIERRSNVLLMGWRPIWI